MRFIRRLGDKISANQKELIVPLWKKFVEFLEYEESEVVSTIYANLFNWIIFLDVIDVQTFDLLILSAKNITKEYDKQAAIEKLLKHVEITPNEVGIIFLQLLKGETLPFYKQESIREIVTILYEHKEEKIANEICEKYWNREMFFLQDIYEKYNC